MQRCPFLSFDEQAAKRKLLRMFEVADTCKSCVECRGVTNRQQSVICHLSSIASHRERRRPEVRPKDSQSSARFEIR
jgi:hypothetical protein